MSVHFKLPKAYTLDGVTLIMKPVTKVYYKDDDDVDFIEFLVHGVGSFRQYKDFRCYPLPDVKDAHYKEFPYRIFDSVLQAWEFEFARVNHEINRLQRVGSVLHTNIEAIKAERGI